MKKRCLPGPRFLCFEVRISFVKESSAAHQLRVFVMGKRTGSREERRAGGLLRRPTSRIWIGPNTEMSEEIITLNAIGSRKGDAAEAEFMARACGLAFRVAKPWGNIDPYDVLVGAGRGFWRVQVKCATNIGPGKYWANGHASSLYTKNDVDFLAVWLVEKNVWYIVPIEAIEGRATLYFRHGTGTRRRESRLERYREAWCLLACPPKARGWKDIPVVCRCRAQLAVRCAVCPRREASR